METKSLSKNLKELKDLEDKRKDTVQTRDSRQSEQRWAAEKNLKVIKQYMSDLHDAVGSMDRTYKICGFKVKVFNCVFWIDNKSFSYDVDYTREVDVPLIGRLSEQWDEFKVNLEKAIKADLKLSIKDAETEIKSLVKITPIK
jgi:hypothetical protein